MFVWDEAQMIPRYAFGIANRTLQCIMNNNMPFGGKIMLLERDFQQLFPIKINGIRIRPIRIRIQKKGGLVKVIKIRLLVSVISPARNTFFILFYF